jgi:ankyrin repeat protein
LTIRVLRVHVIRQLLVALLAISVRTADVGAQLPAEHANLTPLQHQLAEALGTYPPDRQRALALIPRMRGELIFPLREPCGDTVLVYAARSVDFEMLQAVLAQGVGVDDRLLPQPGTDPHMLTCWGQTALMAAVFLPEKHPGIDEKIRAGLRARGFPELADMSAREHNPAARLRMVRLLLDRGANVNLASAGDGATALVFALRSKNVEAAELLMARGASANVRSADPKAWGEWSTSSLALGNLRQLPAPLDAARVRQLENLLDHGMPGPEKDDLLKQAVTLGRPQLVRLLLAHGANANVTRTIPADHSERALLADAVFNRHWDIAEALVDAGGDPNRCMESAKGRCSPLHSVGDRILTATIFSGAPEALWVQMLAHGADINAADTDGLTVLDLVEEHCIRFGHVMDRTRCPATVQVPSTVDQQQARRFLLDHGAVERAVATRLSPAEIAAADPELPHRREALQSGGGFTLAGKFRGRVLDAATGAPIGGAFVMASWRATASGPVHALRLCMHTDAAQADDTGRFEMADWLGYWAPRNMMLYDRQRALAVYKPGYEFVEQRGDNVLLRPTPPDRDRWGVDFMSCGIDPGQSRDDFRETRRHFHGVYAAMAVDMAPFADSPKRRSWIEHLRAEAESCLTDYAKPIMRGREQLEVNIDPADRLTPEQAAR